MASISEIYSKMTLTGFIIFLLGLITLTPEIYLSGIIVMALSTTVELKDLQQQSLETQAVSEEASLHQAYHSW